MSGRDQLNLIEDGNNVKINNASSPLSEPFLRIQHNELNISTSSLGVASSVGSGTPIVKPELSVRGQGNSLQVPNGAGSGCPGEFQRGRSQTEEEFGLPDIQLGEKDPPWKEIPWKSRAKRAGKICVKVLQVSSLLYVFILSLDLMSNGFKLLAGKLAGDVFADDSMMANPIVGLMTGVLATVIVQSSSTSTSIIVTMVANEIVMGANIGTSVSNTLVAFGEIHNPDEFRRAFAGATVHDMFNWLNVLVLLPVEMVTHYLQHLSAALDPAKANGDMGSQDVEFPGLTVITEPLLKKIVIVDKSVITDSHDSNSTDDRPVLQQYCPPPDSTLPPEDYPCKALMNMTGLGDFWAGLILIGFSILLLFLCLFFLVKVLKSIFQGHFASALRTFVNKDLPGHFRHLTGYVAILVGAVMTMVIQSSSIFTSTLTPLVGIGVLTLDRMYPLTLGSNIGTCVTGILAALTADAQHLSVALQIALCHLFFNLTGILIWYPIPIMRKAPLRAAKWLGRTTATYRWFAGFYLLMAFLLLPAFFFGLSMAGNLVFKVVVGSLFAFIVCCSVLTWLQRSEAFKHNLPTLLQEKNYFTSPTMQVGLLDKYFRCIWNSLKSLFCCRLHVCDKISKICKRNCEGSSA